MKKMNKTEMQKVNAGGVFVYRDNQLYWCKTYCTELAKLYPSVYRIKLGR